MIGISEELTVIRPGGALSPVRRSAGGDPGGAAGRGAIPPGGSADGTAAPVCRLLDEGGVNRGFYDLLAHLRTHPNCLTARGERAGGRPPAICTPRRGPGPGAGRQPCGPRPLWVALWWKALAICGTSRSRPETLAVLWKRPTIRRRRIWWSGCWPSPAPRLERPKPLALHASSRATSNTLALWGLVRTRLEERCDITEICLRNGTLEDCAGCPYTTCLHFGEQGGCFYGGVMVQEVYPAIREADALVPLCPNYNDALSANLTADHQPADGPVPHHLLCGQGGVRHRGVRLLRRGHRGLSGGGSHEHEQGLLARRRTSACWRPPTTRARPLALPGIQDRADRFAENMLCQLCI